MKTTHTLNFMTAVLGVVVLTMAGCAQLMHPKIGEFLEQAQAGQTDGITTILNLAGMMEASVKAARAPDSYDSALYDLHDQLHALGIAFHQVNVRQATTTAFVKASVIAHEMAALYHQLWLVRTDQAQREAHLDVFAVRIQELRGNLEPLRP